MRAIVTLLFSTWSREWKSKTFFVFVLVLFLVQALCLVILDHIIPLLKGGELGSFTYQDIYEKFLFFSACSFCLLFSIPFGNSSIESDREALILPSILALPLSRAQYFFGRFLGTLHLLLIPFIFVVMGTFVFCGIKEEFPPLSHSVFAILLFIPLLATTILLCMEVSLLFGGGMFSRFLSWILLVMIWSSNFYFLGPFSIDSSFGVLKLFGWVVHWAFPHLRAIFELMSSSLSGGEVTFPMTQEIGHFVVTFFIHGALALFIFHRKEG